MKNNNTLSTTHFVEEPQKLDLKDLPSHLRYVILWERDNSPIIFILDLSGVQLEPLISVLKRFEQDIRWTIADNIRIPGCN